MDTSSKLMVYMTLKKKTSSFYEKLKGIYFTYFIIDQILSAINEKC